MPLEDMNEFPMHILEVVNSHMILNQYNSHPSAMRTPDFEARLKHMIVTVIKQAVDFLSNEGHIFSTVDDDHFKSTDADL
ncbi:PREDICTED: replication protein A 32 kDa subunit-like [Elephantulus edwardii]|uniref:replication protein A 32 kDa subunit-like n=1 Tax=Elephantulus edwardii TaxID=28737 RepID=UPI0003F0E8A6|nr:PREDICTED: replication protein A 32 kDa subunit-like [Elephantulus edwardii]